MPEIARGDEVIVYETGGSSFAATVTGVGRKLFTIKCDAASRLDGDYRVDTGRRNDGKTRGSGPYVLSMEEWNRRQRLQDVIATLATHGIKLKHNHQLTLEQVEALAQLVRTFTQDEEV